MTSFRLSPADRLESLRRLRVEELDMLVVGGGVVGAGAALDAASRGLTVGLLEQRDWAWGTSSRSSRLAHGGLRYLEQLEFGLVREALAERGLLLERLAPHLVRPVPFILPLTRGWERPYLGAGVALYDALSRISGSASSLRGHRHLSRRSVQRVAPGLAADQVNGAIGFYDAQIDDVRHTLAVVRTAASRGALTLSGVRVTGLAREADRVVGVCGVDTETGQAVRARAKVVLAAVGVWSDQVARWLDRPASAPVVPSIGVHLVVPRDAIRIGTAVIARTPSSVLFLLPWADHWLVGTTDTEWTGDRDDPQATADDVQYLLDQANRWLSRQLGHEDVVGAYAGLRPLIAPPGEDPAHTAKLSREHVVTRVAPGLVSVAGGKYTTYRVMAADAVDVAAKELTDPVPPSRTQFIPLAGAAGFAQMWADRAAMAQQCGVAPDVVARLLRRHGALAYEVLDLIDERPELGQRLHPQSLYVRAEVDHAVTHEDARHLDDVLVRRTRIALVTDDGGRSVALPTARAMAERLGWDDRQVNQEVDSYLVARYGRLPVARGVAAGHDGTPAAT